MATQTLTARPSSTRLFWLQAGLTLSLLLLAGTAGNGTAPAPGQTATESGAMSAKSPVVIVFSDNLEISGGLSSSADAPSPQLEAIDTGDGYSFSAGYLWGSMAPAPQPLGSVESGTPTVAGSLSAGTQ